MNKEFICIVCPRGCRITVDDQMNMKGNQCRRGIDYVMTELTAPKRVLTTTVKTIFPDVPRISVKTDRPIPKELIHEAMKVINQSVIDRPMAIGDILIQGILDTDANIVITKSCHK